MCSSQCMDVHITIEVTRRLSINIVDRDRHKRYCGLQSEICIIIGLSLRLNRIDVFVVIIVIIILSITTRV